MNPPFSAAPITLADHSESATHDAVSRLRQRRLGVADAQTFQSAVEDLSSAIIRPRATTAEAAKQRLLSDPLTVLAINAVVRKLTKAPLSPEHESYLRAIGTGSTPGSTYLAEGIGGELFDIIAAHGAWSTLGVRRVSIKSAKFPVTTAVPDAQFITEGSQISDNEAFGGSSETEEAGIVGILLNVSTQLVEDMDQDLAPDFVEKFERGFNARVDHAVFAGTGVDDGDNGGNTGLFVDTDIPAVVAATGNTKVEDLELEDFLRVLDAAPAGVLQRGAAWWMNPALLVKAMRVSDESGASIVHLEPTPAGPRFYILGYPVHPVAAAPSSNTASKRVAVFGEPAGYVVAVRQGFALEVSRNHRWSFLQRSYRGIGRVRGVLREPNAFVALVTAAS